MVRPVLLNSAEHATLKVVTGHGAGLGDDVMFATTFPSEFRNVQAHYPIFFQKDATSGVYQPLAMFGFREGENLFLSDEAWDATYVPLAVQRQPFLIGYRKGASDSATDRELVVHVDLDSPRISREQGVPVFLPHGGVSDYLDRVNSILHTIHAGMQSNDAFSRALTDYKLLESFTLDIRLNDGSDHRLAGFHTIHEERLQALDGAALASLNEQGFLYAIYMAVASLSHVRELIERKNRQLEAGGGR